MASHLRGPLYYERMGRSGPVIAYIHPNPMDQSCWLFQLAHLSTWYRCLAIDLPGYGRSPGADPGLTLSDMAAGCWEILDDAYPGEPAILVGCSTGSRIAPQMYHLHPSRTLALVLSGAGYVPDGDARWAERMGNRIRSYQEEGVSYRWRYTLEDFSPAFRVTRLAHYFADLFTERNHHADVPSIIRQFEALMQPLDDNFYSDIRCPTIILTGSEDNAHQRALVLKEKILGCELEVLHGAGHACHIEQPWLFDDLMLRFFAKHGLLSQQPDLDPHD